jgi:hypothetical protein
LTFRFSIDDIIKKIADGSLKSGMEKLKSQLQSFCDIYPKTSAQLQPEPPTVTSSGNCHFGQPILLAVMTYFFIKIYVWTRIQGRRMQREAAGGGGLPLKKWHLILRLKFCTGNVVNRWNSTDTWLPVVNIARQFRHWLQHLHFRSLHDAKWPAQL